MSSLVGPSRVIPNILNIPIKYVWSRVALCQFARSIACQQPYFDFICINQVIKKRFLQRVPIARNADRCNSQANSVCPCVCLSRSDVSSR